MRKIRYGLAGFLYWLRDKIDSLACAIQPPLPDIDLEDLVLRAEGYSKEFCQSLRDRLFAEHEHPEETSEHT